MMMIPTALDQATLIGKNPMQNTNIRAKCAALVPTIAEAVMRQMMVRTA
jgi:hypothetical protein